MPLSCVLGALVNTQPLGVNSRHGHPTVRLEMQEGGSSRLCLDQGQFMGGVHTSDQHPTGEGRRPSALQGEPQGQLQAEPSRSKSTPMGKALRCKGWVRSLWWLFLREKEMQGPHKLS